MNILINKFDINNNNYSIKTINNTVTLVKNKEILDKDFHSFGIFPYINPFLYENNLNVTLEFEYEFSDSCNIRIYNGKEWILFNTNKNGKFKNNIFLNNSLTTSFKPKWRIGFSKSISKILLKNIKLTIRITKPFLMIVGASKFSDFNLEKIKDFNTINCYYFKQFFSKKYNIIICSLQ